MPRLPADRTTLLAFATTVVIFAGNWIAIRYSDRELPPFLGAGLRMAAATVVLFAFAAARGIEMPRGRALAAPLVVGFFNYFGNFAFLYWALVVVPAGMGSVIFATLPLWTLFLAVAAGQERLRAMNVVGAVVAVSGLAVVYAGEISLDVPLVRVLGVIGAAICGAIVGVTVKAFPRVHPVANNAIGTLIGAPILLAISRLSGETWAMPQLTGTWIALAYTVFATVVGFASIMFIIVRWTPSAAGYQTALSPVLTVAFAAILGIESVGPTFVVGAAIVGIGVYVGALAAVGSSRASVRAPAVPSV